MFKITKPSDLLNKASYDALTVEEKVQYNEAVAVFAASFNAANPEGLLVVAKLKQLDMSRERPTFVVAKDDNLSSTQFSTTDEIADIIAGQLSVPNANALSSVIASNPNGCTYSVVVKAVTTADTYDSAEGKKHYKVPAIVEVPGTRAEIKLGANAIEFVAVMHEKAAEAAFMAAMNAPRRVRGERTRTRTSAVPATAVTVAEEAEV